MRVGLRGGSERTCLLLPFIVFIYLLSCRARDAITEVFESDYASTPVLDEALGLTDSIRPNSILKPLYDFNAWTHRFNGGQAAVDDVNAYLREPPIYCKDPIAFWMAELSAQRRPQLAQMALDYLTIPCKSSYFYYILTLLTYLIGASIDVERAFSRGRRVISLYRHSLSDDTSRASIMFGSWVAAGMVPRDELIEATRRLRSRAPTSSLPAPSHAAPSHGAPSRTAPPHSTLSRSTLSHSAPSRRHARVPSRHQPQANHPPSSSDHEMTDAQSSSEDTQQEDEGTGQDGEGMEQDEEGTEQGDTASEF